nr:sulfurtransferase [Iodidimonas nitroreducens]
MKRQAPSPLVSTDWLEQHLSAPDIRVLDASWHLPDSDHDARADYRTAHIPGAVFFDLDEISDPDAGLPHMLPSLEAFSSAMRRLGIGDGSTIIVYDTGDLHSAARAWWMFRVFGQRDVFVLDGGLGKWRREGRPLEDLPPGPRERHFSARRHDNLVADLDAVIKASTKNTAQILDARGNPRFLGLQPNRVRGWSPAIFPVPSMCPMPAFISPMARSNHRRICNRFLNPQGSISKNRSSQAVVLGSPPAPSLWPSPPSAIGIGRFMMAPGPNMAVSLPSLKLPLPKSPRPISGRIALVPPDLQSF